jgi:hypothetical protein
VNLFVQHEIYAPLSIEKFSVSSMAADPPAGIVSAIFTMITVEWQSGKYLLVKKEHLDVNAKKNAPY